MAGFGEGGFNANDHEPMRELSVLPACDVIAAVTESDKKETKDGRGYYHALTWTILEGEYKGRKHFSNLNTGHVKPDVKAIAFSELSSICRAIAAGHPGAASKVMNLRDTQDLHDLPICLSIGVRKQKDPTTNKRTGEPENYVKAYKSRNEAEASKPATATAAGAPESPWKQSK